MNREIEQIYCSCGGIVEEIDTTEKEEEKYGCGERGCCVRSYKCNKCGICWLFNLNAPEME